ncbi:MAG: cadmium-translocating P-type ATPase [Chlamydiia bacterium]|nr:cadmium-translocating P-type ATPase [Chlamydiia bacterium]
MDPIKEKTELKIEGMHCVSCEGTIGQALTKVPGVLEAKVSFVGGEATVICEPGKVNHKALINAVGAAGYKAHIIAGADDEEIAKGERFDYSLQLVTVIITAILTLPLLSQMFLDIFDIKIFVPLWGQFVLGTLVQFGAGWRFYMGSYYALKTFTGNMDLLIGLGTSAAWIYSTAVYLFKLPHPVYFESSASIITLVLLGRLLESRTKTKASAAIKTLFKLQPKMALKAVDGTWIETPVEELRIGDIFKVKPGEKVPIDGVVTKGSSHLDESMLTGESAPVKKEVGDKIYAATQNQYGVLIGEATALGSETTLASIIHLVKEAQASRAPIQRLADKIAGMFVPIVLGISLLTLLLWWSISHDFTHALINMVAVLVIACPCALGMATPTVIMVATGLGARLGILIKNAEAIQQAQKLTRLAVDKTGTLTEGKPKITAIHPFEKMSSDDILQITASLEEHSEHPIAKAVVDAYKGELLELELFEAKPGQGVMGKFHGQFYFAGSLNWMEEKGIRIDQKKMESIERGGETLLALSDGKSILGVIGVSDTLRPHSKRAVTLLQNMGVEVVMLTGDHKKTAQAIGEEVGITHIEAQILPSDKATTVKKLKSFNQFVGMVGDGVNDAPALAAADVSFAMRTGTDIAIEAADITLMKSDLLSIPTAIELSKKTFQKIKQNLFFAFIYNMIGIPLAAIGWLNPIIAGAAMAASSLCVVTNALLLNSWKPKK